MEEKLVTFPVSSVFHNGNTMLKEYRVKTILTSLIAIFITVST